ncbi:uroporphyrinogen-III C-methyltransferase [Marinobacter sp. V034]|uniref:uroporphyrinogen-III C-methyltransferase n=1 Tax=Marinobacter sp. V034 TaxID=3459610 RepID=UPI002683CC41|tara:strand:+ start:406 stop:1545 length:1140 start_codon:yes stop_codon:yes gene_type:complete
MPVTDSTTNLPAPVPPQTQQPRRLWPLWLIAVFALVAVILLGLWAGYQWQQQQAINKSIAYLESATDKLDRTYSQTGGQLNSQMQAIRAEIGAQQTLTSEHGRQIDHNARALLEAGNRTRTDWLLAEAEYLLRIGNQRLQIEQDYRGALSALQAADTVLKETEDAGVYPIRKQVAREVLALKSIEDVDRTGLYLQLEAAIDVVGNLTDRALSIEASTAFTQQLEQDPEQLKERGALAVGWAVIKETLSKAISIRRLDEPVKPLLSPDQSAYARLNMRLMLEEAEMAVLRGNQTLYERALLKADGWLASWYDSSHSAVVALREDIGELSKKNINPELPDISSSLNLLKARMEGRLNATTGEAKDKQNNAAPDDAEAGDAS